MDAPITIVFNEPIARGILSDDSAVELTPPMQREDGSVLPPALSLGADQRTLEVTFAGLAPSTDYTLAVSPIAVTDLRGNALDQQPATEVLEPFVMQLRTAAVVGTIGGVARVALAAGLPRNHAVLWGALLALSSTAIIR